MRRKIIIPVVLAATVIAVLVGVLVVPARGSAGATTTAATTTLPTLSPLELFARWPATLPGTTAVHGQFTWTNNVLGDSFQLPASAGHRQGPVQERSGRVLVPGRQVPPASR